MKPRLGEMKAARAPRRPGSSRRRGVSKQCSCEWKRNGLPVQPLQVGGHHQAGARYRLVEQPPQTAQVEFHFWPGRVPPLAPTAAPVQMLITGHRDSRINV